MRRSFISGGSAAASSVLTGGGVGLVEPPGKNSTGGVAVSTEAAARARPPFFTFARKMFLSLLGIGVASAIVGQTMQSTHSTFTASSVNPNNTFVAGTLLMTNSSGSCTQIVASTCGALNLNLNTGMSPGDVATGTVTITNSGTLPALMTLALANLSSSGLESSLNLTIYDAAGSGYCVRGKGGTSGGSGSCDSLAGLPTGTTYPFAAATNISLPPTGSTYGSRWAPGEAHTYTLSVEVGNNVTVAQANLTSSLDLVWQAIQ